MQTISQRFGKILSVAWPLIIANSFWNLQLTIDRVFLGMYSTEALGAAMAVMGVFWVPMALLQQTASYVTTFIAQYFGANEKKKIGPSFWQAIYISVVGGVLFLVLNFFTPMFFSFVGHTEHLQALEVSYFNSLGFSALPTALTATISGFYTGIGVTKAVISVNLVGLVLHVILDYIMLFGKFGVPSMGIAGAGYASAISTYGAAAWGLYLIFKNKNYEHEFKILSRWKADLALLKTMIRYGIPSGLQWALEGLAFTVFLILMGRLSNGEAVLASSSIAVTVMMLSVLPTMGVAQAVMTLVGQRLGEQRPSEAEAITWDGVKISLIYIGFIAMSFWLFPQFYVSWFKNEENMALWSGVTQLAPIFLSIVAVFTIFDSAYLNISFALKGAGDTKFVSLVSLIVPWPFMILPAHLLREHDHAAVLSWMFVALYSAIVTSILIVRFRLGRWKTMSVIRSES